jgi:hypothetical protein
MVLPAVLFAACSKLLGRDVCWSASSQLGNDGGSRLAPCPPSAPQTPLLACSLGCLLPCRCRLRCWGRRCLRADGKRGGASGGQAVKLP